MPATFSHIIPFILAAEGGFVDNPSDPGGATNEGVTWTTWQTFFGNTYQRFLSMDPADWGVIFKAGYWDQVIGDQINSQRIADIIVDWVYNSGKLYPEENVQNILITIFKDQITEDGDFGPKTIAAINSADEPTLWNDLIAKRQWYYTQIVINDPSQNIFLQGWLNRVTNLVTFENTGVIS